MPAARGSNRKQLHGGYVKPETHAAIKSYLECTGRKMGHLTDDMWRAYCEREGMDIA